MENKDRGVKDNKVLKNKRSLRELVKDSSILIIPGVYDPLTARIAEECGFQCSQNYHCIAVD